VGTTWQLVQIMAHDITPENDCYTLLLRSNGTLTGKGDCNVFTATYRMTSSRELSISDIGSTRKLCPDFESENAFFDLLETVTHYEMDADIMLLLSNGTLVGMMKALPEDTKLDYLPL
jgi:heat shock protein HslJ